jgi:MoaA/NifB/PqqE/SkfB family radical SAM enzyme
LLSIKAKVFVYPVQFVDYLVRKKPKHLILHVTSRCNRRCKHCFIDFTSPQDLPLETCKALGGALGRFLWLDIGGGEPFLRSDLPDIVAAFDAEVVMIPTNGSLGDRAVEQIKAMRLRSKAKIGVSLSLEGLKETNDEVRGRNSWDEVWSTFEKLRKLNGLHVKINTVLTRRNAGEMIALMQEVQRHKPDFHSVMLLRSEPADASTELPAVDELRRLMPQILGIQGSYAYGRNALAARFLRGYHQRMWDVALDTIERRTQSIPCLGGQAHLVVWANGAVASCEMLKPVGNLRDKPLQEILQSAEFGSQRASIRRKECFCTHNCAMLDSILFNPLEMARLAGRFAGWQHVAANSSERVVPRGGA